MLLGDKTFREQFWYFAIPYGFYILGNTLGSNLGGGMAPALGGLAAGGSLLYFASQGRYRFGAIPKPGHWIWALLLGLFATLVWVLTYRFTAALLAGGANVLESQSKEFSFSYIISRGIASTLIIPIAEELFIRVFVLEAVHTHQANQKSQGSSWIWQKTLDLKPTEFGVSPITLKATLLTGVVFALGHSFVAWFPAILWFGLTQWLYQRTRNLTTVIAAHMLANGLITYLVAVWKWNWLW